MKNLDPREAIPSSILTVEPHDSIRAYGVRRPLIAINTELPEANMLSQIFYEISTLKNLGVSIIGPSTARNIAMTTELTPDQLNNNLSNAVKHFPELLNARLGEVAVLGERAEKTGRWVVAYLLTDDSMGIQINKERKLIIDQLPQKINYEKNNHNNHLSVFGSFTEKKAQRIADSLRQTSPANIEIELGRAVLFPLISHIDLTR